MPFRTNRSSQYEGPRRAAAGPHRPRHRWQVAAQVTLSLVTLLQFASARAEPSELRIVQILERRATAKPHQETGQPPVSAVLSFVPTSQAKHAATVVRPAIAETRPAAAQHLQNFSPHLDRIRAALPETRPPDAAAKELAADDLVVKTVADEPIRAPQSGATTYGGHPKAAALPPAELRTASNVSAWQQEPVPLPSPAAVAGDTPELTNRSSAPSLTGCCTTTAQSRRSAGCRVGDCPYCPTQSGAHSICGIDCGNCRAPCSATWDDLSPIPWSMFGPGEYAGPPRTAHVSQYYLRVNDRLDVVYMKTRQKSSEAYRIGIGDRMAIDSISDDELDREVNVQPDGTIALPLVGEVQAAGRTVAEFRADLVQVFKPFQRDANFTVNLMTVNVALSDLLDAVDRRSGSGGQSQFVTVTPEGTIQLPGLGSVYVQGLSLEELQRELEVRYLGKYGVGLSVTPMLTERAPSFVFIGGEVRAPGRYTLEGPTTVMQAITLAGGWNVGGNTNQIVVFRRDENWCLKATKIDLFKPLYGKDPCPVNDIWLRDNDLIIIPKRAILVADDIIDLYFTRGAYRVFPMNFVYNFSQGSVIPVGAVP